MDADVIVLKSFDPLRRYRTTMGRESSFGICNGIIISAKGAPFIRMLLEQYDSYTGENEGWAYRSVKVTHELAKNFQNYVHIEEKSLQRPGWQELDEIYIKKYNWTNNYSVHLWIRLQIDKNKKLIPNSVNKINCADTTIGEIARHVIYGSKSQRENCSLKLITSTSAVSQLTTLNRAGYPQRWAAYTQRWAGDPQRWAGDTSRRTRRPKMTRLLPSKVLHRRPSIRWKAQGIK